MDNQKNSESIMEHLWQLANIGIESTKSGSHLQSAIIFYQIIFFALGLYIYKNAEKRGCSE